VDFSLTDEQDLLRDTAHTLLVRECPTTLLRAHMDDPSVAQPLWEHLREFCALGTGSAVDLCLFVEETGYVAAPGPFFATVALFAPLLDVIGSDLLEKVLAGDVTGTVALAGQDGVWRANGDATKTFVPEADRVEHVAVVDAGPTVTVADGPPIRLVETIDTTRRLFDVDASSVRTSPAVSVDPDALTRAVQRATVVLAAEQVGTCRRLFDMSLAYAKERVQFDRPIGSFQAVQHKLADMALDLERSWAAVYYAAMTLDADDAERHRAAHVAKAAAGDAVRRIGKDSVQIHGGIGYTWEHDLHLFVRRAFASEAWLGNADWHHDRLAELIT
jgi:alkylation response protein AidB-like acyl-CoA dehydrogenase